VTVALLEALSWRQAIISAVCAHHGAVEALTAAELHEYHRRTAHLRERAHDEAVSQW
jgi:hypothetical protein